MKRNAIIHSIAVIIGFLSTDASAGNPWSTTDSLLISRAHHRTVALQDGGALVVGGGQIYANYVSDPDFGDSYEEVHGPLNSCERFDPTTETWSSTGSTSATRYQHTATLLNSGQILIAGGYDTYDYFTQTTQSSAELYDTASGTWSTASSMNLARAGHLATLLQDGKVLVVGGAGSSEATQKSAEIFNPTTATWSFTGSMTATIVQAAAVCLSDGRVMVIGGTPINQNSVEIYDPSTGLWSSAAIPTLSNSTLQDVVAHVLPDGRVLALIGGYSTVAEVRIYDPSTDIWTDGPPAPPVTSSWSGLVSTPLPGGDLLVLNRADEILVYDASDEEWLPQRAPSTYADQGTASMATLASGKVLRAGGAQFDLSLSVSESTQACLIFDPAVEGGILSVELPEGTPLENGGAAVDFGAVPVGGAKSITLTVRNLSATEILPNIVSYSFYNSPRFPVAPQPPLTLAPGATGAFTITFRPNAPGTINGVDRLYANYSTIPFTINVTGTGTTGTPYEQAASAAGLTGNAALPNAIPFHDGVPNLLKFAFGLDLAGSDARRMTSGGTIGLPTAYLHENGGTVFRVEYLRRKNSGLTYTPKKSTSLMGGSFTPLTGTPMVSDIGDGSLWERVTIDEPYNPATTPKLFTVVEVSGE